MQAKGDGVELSAPAAPAGTQLAAQFSMTWYDVPPSMIGETQAAAYKAAILKGLPAGALGAGQGRAGTCCTRPLSQAGGESCCAGLEAACGLPMAVDALIPRRCFRVLHN